MMASSRPFAEDQAEGLRRMMSAANARKAFVVGFIASNKDARADTAIDLLGSSLRSSGKSALLVDEQVHARMRGAGVIHRPAGTGEGLLEHRHDHDYILVDAYPSRESYIHGADMLVLTSRAPEIDTDNIQQLLKAICRVPKEIGVLLTSTGDNLPVLGARKAIEDIAERDFGRTLHWIGSIPMDQNEHSAASSAADCVDRIERIRKNKEPADV